MRPGHFIPVGGWLLVAGCSVYNASLLGNAASNSGGAQGQTGGLGGAVDLDASDAGSNDVVAGAGGLTEVGGSPENGSAGTTSAGSGGSSGMDAGATSGMDAGATSRMDAGATCVTETDAAFCTRLAKNCGSVTASDNCDVKRTVQNCGKCTAPQTCAGTGTANVCGCAPETEPQFCARVAKNCGSVTANDNCGKARSVPSCGACTALQTCGASVPNVCGTVTTVDDSVLGTGTNQFSYTGGGWLHCTPCQDGAQIAMYNDSNSWDSTTNDYFTVKFSGTQITLYGVKDLTNGIGAISIDGGAESSLDFYGATRVGNQLLWKSPTLPSGAHTLKVRVTGTKNASSTSYIIVPDRVDISS